jgi:acylphosphatase
MTEMTESIPQKGFRVTGRVQGVGFRWWTQKKGVDLGISGTVKNLPDGSVEVHAVGLASALDEFRALLRKGPWSATVTSVEEIPSLDALPAVFEVRF